MNISILAPAILSDASCFDSIRRLFDSIRLNWSDWAWPDPTPYKTVAYFEAYPMDYWIAEKSFLATVAYNAERYELYVIGEDETSSVKHRRLRILEAAAFCHQALIVILENQINDGDFFTRVVADLDEELASRFGELSPSVRWSHGGGNTSISALLTSMSKEAGLRGLPLRCLVVIDSDARYPGHVGEGSADVVAAAAKCGVGSHLLNKRAIENYASDRLLEDYAAFAPDVKDTVSFFLTLSPTQRDFYHFKAGLRAGDRTPEEVELFGDAEYLARLPGLMSFALSQTDFPTRDDLESRGAVDEMLGLCAEIWRWL